MSILIVGLGFVGLNLALYLKKKNFNIKVIVRKPRSSIRKYFIHIAKKYNIEIFEVDTLNRDNILKILKEYDIKYVINCVGALRGSYEDLYTSNIKVPLEIANSILESGRDIYLIHISTAYLSQTSKEVFEEDNYLDERFFKPKTNYEKTKYLCEKYLYEYSRRGLRLIILRPVMMLGKYCYHDESNIFIYMLRRFKYIPIIDKGFNILDVENFCYVVENVISKVYNINFEFMYIPGTYYTLTEILEAFSNALNIEPRYVKLPLISKILPILTPSVVRPYLKYLDVKFMSKRLSKYVSIPRDDILKIANDQVSFLRELRVL